MPKKLIANDNLLFIPPEKVWTIPLLFCHKLTFSKPSWIATYKLSTYFKTPNIFICYSAVNSYHKISNWGHTPKIFLIYLILVSISRLSIKTLPWLDDKAPTIILINVDFPAPFYPSSDMISPLFIPKDTPFKAWTSFP